MKKKRAGRIFQDLSTPLVRVLGNHLKAGSESEHPHSHSPADHLWISLNSGVVQRITISLNIFSLRNHDAGFDPRVRIGILPGRWDSLPERGILECHRFSYEELPEIDSVEFLPLERVELEELILDKVQRASFLEAWGVPYHRELPGIHQIHSRRPSCAVAESLVGEDGALRLYFHQEQRTETLLFKFCGQ